MTGHTTADGSSLILGEGEKLFRQEVWRHEAAQMFWVALALEQNPSAEHEVPPLKIF